MVGPGNHGDDSLPGYGPKRHSDQYTAEDMEEVGRRLMDAIHANQDALKGWYPADCPTEIVVDLINERDDALAEVVRLRSQWATIEDAKAFLEREALPYEIVPLGSAAGH